MSNFLTESKQSRPSESTYLGVCPSERLKHLKLLAQSYPTLSSASGELLYLQMALSLPKGTEYFFSDLHGEAGSFIHLLRSASGRVRQKIRELFGQVLTEEEQNQLANLVYDADQVIERLKKSGRLTENWKRVTTYRLVQLLRLCTSKYARERIERKTPSDFSKIIDELLTDQTRSEDRDTHREAALQVIMNSPNCLRFVRAVCQMIQNICVDQLHIIGDIYDRGPGPHHIVEALMSFPDVDIQWGNHDVSWMGAVTGNEVCMANVVRIAVSYNNFDCLEDGYAINLRPLYSFAQKIYADDPCTCFGTKLLDQNQYDTIDATLSAKMHKAIAIIQFKLEGQLIKSHPEFGMEDRIVLEKIDYQKGTYRHQGKEYLLKDTHFPTIDPSHPLQLTPEEEDVLKALQASFRHGEALHRHMKYLFNYGSTYLTMNGNLLFHGCIPMNPDGTFRETVFLGRSLSGKDLMDECTRTISNAWFSPFDAPEQKWSRDLMYYFWCGKDSPLFGKSQISTFENYFLDDKKVREEQYDPYYHLVEDPAICQKILSEFGLDPESSHIINGHVPVKIKDGESPVKAQGKYFVIDGGISKAYQPKTGIAGYTMIFSSHELALVEHTHFGAIQDDEGDYMPQIKVIETMPHRLTLADTNEGAQILEKIQDLKDLVEAYEEGWIRSSDIEWTRQ